MKDWLVIGIGDIATAVILTRSGRICSCFCSSETRQAEDGASSTYKALVWTGQRPPAEAGAEPSSSIGGFRARQEEALAVGPKENRW
jgi:hypothetical protein